MVVDDSIQHAYRLLEQSRAFDALEVIWGALDEADGDGSIELLLAHARMVGHVGDYSEALRVVEELSRREDAPLAWRDRCRIWAAVYWSRLGDLNRARQLLSSIQPPEDDPEYQVLYWGHRLTIATEAVDDDEHRDVLDSARAACDRLPAGEDRQEFSVWIELLGHTAKGRLDPSGVDGLLSGVSAMVDGLRKQSSQAHIWYRCALLCRFHERYAEAIEYLLRSREVALAGNSAFAFLRATLLMIELESERPSAALPEALTRRTLIAQAMVVAGQIGLGLLPSPVSLEICRLAEEFPTRERSRYRRWLHAERYRPDITRLSGDRFERWCNLFFQEYGHSFFQIASGSYEVSVKPAGFPGLDLQLTHAHVNAGIQCKGGRSSWTKSRLKKEIRKIDTELKKFRQDGGTCFVFACTTKLTQHAVEALEVELGPIGLSLKVLDVNDWDRYLLQDPGLRFQLCLAAVDE